VKPEKVKFSMMNFFTDVRALDTEGMEGAEDIKVTRVVKALSSDTHGQSAGKELKDALTFTTMTLRKNEK
jgi:hypothetical protein